MVRKVQTSYFSVRIQILKYAHQFTNDFSYDNQNNFLQEVTTHDSSIIKNAKEILLLNRRKNEQTNKCLSYLAVAINKNHIRPCWQAGYSRANVCTIPVCICVENISILKPRQQQSWLVNPLQAYIQCQIIKQQPAHEIILIKAESII